MFRLSHPLRRRDTALPGQPSRNWERNCKFGNRGSETQTHAVLVCTFEFLPDQRASGSKQDCGRRTLCRRSGLTAWATCGVLIGVTSRMFLRMLR
jgi:hypothetical protein